jgi:hypothetical protein
LACSIEGFQSFGGEFQIPWNGAPEQHFQGSPCRVARGASWE